MAGLQWYFVEVLCIAAATFVNVGESLCDTSLCPVVCTYSPSTSGSPVTTVIDLSGPTRDCQAVILETAEYPNGYTDGRYTWDVTVSPQASFALTFVDFDVDDSEDVRVIRRRTTDSGVEETNLILLADITDVNELPGRTIVGTGTQLIVVFRAFQDSHQRRGVKIRILLAGEDAGSACASTEDIALNNSLPWAAIGSPLYPSMYLEGSRCFYQISSPPDTDIIFEIVGRFHLTEYEDFIYIYDVRESDQPKVIRVLSGSYSPVDEGLSPSRFHTGTNRVLLVFADYPGTRTGGFFFGITFENVPPPCSGRGNLTERCECHAWLPGPSCEFSEDEDLILPIDEITETDLTHRCDPATNVTSVSLRFDDLPGTWALLASPFFLTPDPTEVDRSCRWSITGPEGSSIRIRFRAFALESKLDYVRIDSDEQRDGPAYVMYSPTGEGFPVSCDGDDDLNVTHSSLRIDSDSVLIEYHAGTEVPGVNNGVLFEVRLVDVGLCSTTCLNGGRCRTSCQCENNFQGEICEHDIPADTSCLVKHHQVVPTFPNHTNVFGAVGTPSTRAKYIRRCDGGCSDRWSLDGSYAESVTSPQNISWELLTFGVFCCVFEGDEFVEPVVIPAIANPKSEYISRVGQPTTTASVGDGVTMSVVTELDHTSNLRWRINGLLRPDFSGQTEIHIQNTTTDYNGLYEAFLDGSGYTANDYVIQRLIVRACPDGSYGPPSCSEQCPVCLNGGSCHDTHGTCICPPGYAGSDCNELLGQGIIGRNRSVTCNGTGISNDWCETILFCLPDPAGCMCMSGWTGSGCDIPCEPKRFGLECQFTCHCSDGDQCDVATGACPDSCENGYTGPNCQQHVS